MTTGYCVKCKATREIQDPRQITMKNGRPATEGRCPVCGTKIFKIGAPSPAAHPEAAPAAPGGGDEATSPTPGDDPDR